MVPSTRDGPWSPAQAVPPPSSIKSLVSGTGGHARYVVISPADWKYGATIGASDAPLPRSAKALPWDASTGTRVRK